MKCVRVLVAILVFGAAAWADENQEVKSLTSAIRVHLMGDGTHYQRAKYGRRTVQLVLEGAFEMRATLSLLLGEPLRTHVVRTPHVRRVVFEADAAYANEVGIRSIGDDRGENHVSESVGVGDVLVSQDVIDRLGYYDFTFSLCTIPLDRLPVEFYSGADDLRRRDISVIDPDIEVYLADATSNSVCIHSPITGVLPSRPGVWGWDVPGSPDWGEFMSSSELPLGEGERELPESRRLPAAAAREAFRRILYHHGLGKNVFVGATSLPTNRFLMQNLRVNATDLLRVIREQRPEVYRIVMEREKPAGKDADVLPLIAGVGAAYAEAVDERGILQPSAELDRRMAATEQAIAAAGASVSDEVRREWTEMRQRYADAPFERRLAGFGQVLSGLTDDTFSSRVNDRTRRQVAALRADAEGRGSPRLLHRIRAVERLVNLTPPPKLSSVLLLIDTSGSMDSAIGNGNSENRMVAARSAAIAAVERVADSGGVEVAVLGFSGDCGDPVPRYLDFTTEVERLTGFINSLQAGGGTPMSSALRFANRFMEDRRDPHSRLQTIVLLADGDNNEDCGPVGQALADLHTNGIVFRHETVGFGIEPGSQAAQDLRRVAVESGGTYHHAATAAQLAEMFQEVTDPFTVMDLFGMIDPGSPAQGAGAPARSGEPRAAGGGDSSGGVTSMLGMFGSAKAATTEHDRQRSNATGADAGVTSMLGMFAAAPEKEESAGGLAIPVERDPQPEPESGYRVVSVYQSTDGSARWPSKRTDCLPPAWAADTRDVSDWDDGMAFMDEVKATCNSSRGPGEQECSSVGLANTRWATKCVALAIAKAHDYPTVIKQCWAGAGGGPSLSAAESDAIGYCQDDGRLSCSIVFSACAS